MVAQYSDLWWYADGTLAADQRAAVFEDDANTYASIFSDAGLTTPLSNPTVTDSAGLLEFFAANGDYWIFVGEEATGDSVLVTLGPAVTGAVLSVNGHTGVVVLDSTDVGAQPIATINAKGDLYAGTGNDATTRRSVGADGQVLTADSADPTGMSWQAGGGGGAVTSVNGHTGAVVLAATDVGADAAGAAAAAQAAAQAASQPIATINAKGDIYVGTANDTTTRKGVGIDGTVLTASAADPTGVVWATPAADAVTSVNGQTGVVVLGAADVGADPTGAAAAVQALALLKANNLSDVANPATSRTNLGLGTAAVANTGVGATNVILGNDARLTDARTPTAHASTHASAGSDPVTLAQSQITNLATDLAAKQPLDSDLTAIAGLTPSVSDFMQFKGAAWANRTIAQVKTDLAYTAADVSAVPTTRQVIAGTAMSGGGALSADITMNVALGTSGSTAAAGNDSRIVGAQQKSDLTTKGDLYVATASATIARQGVGSNGQVLTADSAQTNGLKWATPSSGGASSGAMMPRSTGYIPTGGTVTTRSSKTAPANTMYLIPFALLSAATLTSIAFEVTANIATALARLGIYTADATTLLPSGAPLVDFGTFTADTITTRQCTVSQALTAGVWWLAFVGQTAAPTVRQCAGWSPYVASATFPAGSGVGWDNCYVQTAVSGALPSIGALADSDGPMCGLKF